MAEIKTKSEEKCTVFEIILCFLDVPMGQLPVLEIEEGKVRLCQSVAIGRFLAKEFDLVGKNNVEAALCDMYVDGVSDLLPHLRPVIMAAREGNEEKKV